MYIENTVEIGLNQFENFTQCENFAEYQIYLFVFTFQKIDIEKKFAFNSSQK